MAKKAELIVDDRKLQVSNLDKVLYPKAGFTKAQVIDYYIRIAPVLLPHLRSPAHNEALSRRRGRAVFLREELPPASAEMGTNGKGVERGQPADHALLSR